MTTVIVIKLNVCVCVVAVRVQAGLTRSCVTPNMLARFGALSPAQTHDLLSNFRRATRPGNVKNKAKFFIGVPPPRGPATVASRAFRAQYCDAMFRPNVSLGMHTPGSVAFLSLHQ